MTDKCLTEAEIAAFVDGSAGPDLVREIEAHLALCGACLRSVAEVKRLADAYETSPVRTPQAALSRAMDIVRTRAHAAPGLSIVATLHEGILKILETTGSLIPPPRLAPVQVRSKQGTGPAPRVARSMSGHLVTVELGREDTGFTVDVTLLEEKSDERPDGVKVKLYSAQSTQTRYSRAGRVRFASLEKGTSDLDIEGVGRISLEIR